jgi:hypothetical protein
MVPCLGLNANRPQWKVMKQNSEYWWVEHLCAMLCNGSNMVYTVT